MRPPGVFLRDLNDHVRTLHERRDTSVTGDGTVATDPYSAREKGARVGVWALVDHPFVAVMRTRSSLANCASVACGWRAAKSHANSGTPASAPPQSTSAGMDSAEIIGASLRRGGAASACAAGGVYKERGMRPLPQAHACKPERLTERGGVQAGDCRTGGSSGAPPSRLGTPPSAGRTARTTAEMPPIPPAPTRTAIAEAGSAMPNTK
jgi:hypothetical protein